MMVLAGDESAQRPKIGCKVAKTLPEMVESPVANAASPEHGLVIQLSQPNQTLFVSSVLFLFDFWFYFGATEMLKFGFGLFDSETVSEPNTRNRITLRAPPLPMRTQQQLGRDSKFKMLLGDGTPNCTVGDASAGNVAVAVASGRVGGRPEEGGGVVDLLCPISVMEFCRYRM